MLYHAASLTVKTGSTHMDYVRFGAGPETLVLLPGLSLRGVRGSALLLAYMYRIFAKDYTVYVLDKKAAIPEAYAIREMAEDAARVMEKLGISGADVFGVSQGGMIAQYLAIDHPRLVRRLVLGVTASRENGVMREVIHTWVHMAENGQWEEFGCDMLQRMYSDAYIRKYGRLFPVLAKLGKPKNPDRFIALAKACLTCDAYGELEKISCPAFVIGGRQDKVLTGEASREIAEKLRCRLFLYGSFGHAAYEEAGDFNTRVYQFLRDKT